MQKCPVMTYTIMGKKVDIIHKYGKLEQGLHPSIIIESLVEEKIVVIKKVHKNRCSSILSGFCHIQKFKGY